MLNQTLDKPREALPRPSTSRYPFPHQAGMNDVRGFPFSHKLQSNVLSTTRTPLPRWLQVRQREDLRERHLGLLQGLTMDEAAVTQPQALAALSQDMQIPGGGESMQQLRQRAAHALQQLAAAHPGESASARVKGKKEMRCCSLPLQRTLA